MVSLNRDERQTLRVIQSHLRASALQEHAIAEQLGTVDVYFHTTNSAPHLNCAMPHKGVAWVRRDDLEDAFEGLIRLGRTPRLTFLNALFPDAFQHQVKMMGLSLEVERVMMVYQPLIGPNLPGETPLGSLPDTFPPQITTYLATTRAELATWLRVFRGAYYNTDSLMVQPNETKPLHTAAQQGKTLFVVGNYENTPLGVARIAVRPPTAELEVVATAPLWHGMGLEIALITTAVQAALRWSCSTIFAIVPPDQSVRLYRRLGFIDLTHILTYWRLDDAVRRLAEAPESLHAGPTLPIPEGE